MKTNKDFSVPLDSRVGALDFTSASSIRERLAHQTQQQQNLSGSYKYRAGSSKPVQESFQMATRSSTVSMSTNSSNAFDDDHSKDSFYKKYRKTDNKLGAGGFGTVYDGFQISDGAAVAIKVVECIKTLDKVHEEKDIPMEVRLLKTVACVPRVVRLYGWYLFEGNFYIVMEKPEGAIDLHEYIKQQKVLSEGRVRELFRQVVETVIACYNLGVIHCDIKTSNVLIDQKSKQITLIDFGVGAFMHDLAEKTFCGTRIYAPPEYTEFGIYEAIPATVWSLGTLLFEMVCGEPPFANDKQIFAVKYDLTRNVSPECSCLIGKCFTFNPEERLTLDDILNEVWLQQCVEEADNTAVMRRLFCWC